MEELVVAVLLNYNQNDYTLKCINSLILSDYGNLKIILIDNGSSASNAEDLEKKLPNNSSLIYKRIKDNIGYSRGTNLGLERGLKLNPSYFLILNNDTIIDSRAVSELVKTCKDYNKKAIVTGKVYEYSAPEKLQMVGYKYKNKKIMTYERMGFDEIDEGQYEKLEERVMIDDVMVLHPVEVYINLGGYTEYLFINGVNVDLGLRVKKNGFKLIYTPKAKIWHKGSVSIGGRTLNPKLAYLSIQSALILRFMHLKKRYFIVYYFMTLKGIIGTGFKSLINNDSNDSQLRKYALAKYYGLQYFHKWVVSKNINLGRIPEKIN